MLKKGIVIIFTLVAVYVLATTYFVLSPSISDYFNRTKFDNQTWVDWEDSETTQKVRWNMISDLTCNYDLENKTATELISLLGKPSFVSKNEIRYFLGLTGHGINTGSLIFKIKEGKVITYKVWQG